MKALDRAHSGQPGHALEGIVGDLDVFFTKYFSKEPMLRRGAMADCLKGLPRIAELDDLLALATVPASYIRMSQHSKALPTNLYRRTVANGRAFSEELDRDKVARLFEAGGTVIWNNLEHFIPSVMALQQSFAEAFACATDSVLFVTPAGNEGLAPHCDTDDTYVIQIDGRKSWNVWNTPVGRSGEAMSYAKDDLGEPALELTLEPGDLLYMPYGTPHAAAATDGVSLHITIGVKPRRWRHLLREIVEAILQEDDFDEFPLIVSGHEPTVQTRLAEMISLLSARLAQVDLESEGDRLAVTGRSLTGGPTARTFGRLAAADTMAADTPLRRSTVSIEIGQIEAGKARLIANGHQVAVPIAIADTLRALKAGDAVVAADILADVSADRSLRAARSLVRLGVLEPSA